MMLQDWHKDLINKWSDIDNVELRLKELSDKAQLNISKLIEHEKNIKRIEEEKTKSFPWLADAIAKYYEIKDIKIAEYLENKVRSAESAAKTVRSVAKEKKELRKQMIIARNRVKYYESLFPWLTDYVDRDDIDELIEEVGKEVDEEINKEDPVLNYISKSEYTKLSVVERNQKALDRYWNKRKKNWEIGRDYERYVGYVYEEEGYQVTYYGIEEGILDLGRDLIAIKENEIRVIQCKMWSQYKKIHEKHIAQLFGTTLKYWIENNKTQKKQLDLFEEIKNGKIKGVFVTSTELSEVAMEFADELDIEYKNNFHLKDYPCIKCNISRKDKEQIYHLPMDQQYDKVVIEKDKGEFYARTVKEAENAGFRRAFRWKGK